MTLKLKEILNLRTVSKTKYKKKILLINPRRTNCRVNIPHMGLAILAAILKKRGHEVLVVDYLLAHNAPPITHFINKFILILPNIHYFF